MVDTASEWRPRLIADLRVHEVDDGGRFVQGTRRASSVYVEPPLAPLLSLIDGDHSVKELVEGRYATSGRLDFAAPLGLLRALDAEGLLQEVPETARRELLTTRKSPGAWLGRLADISLMIPMPSTPHPGSRVLRTLMVGGLVTLGLLLFPLSVIAVGDALFQSSFHPLRVHGSIGDGVLLFVLAIVSTLSFRGLLRGLYLILCGFPPAGFGLRIRFGIPFLDVRGSAQRHLPRQRALELALLGLATPALVAGVGLEFYWMSGAEIALKAGFAAMLVLIADLCPFARSDVSSLLQLRYGIDDFQRRVYSFVVRRMLRNVGRRGPISRTELRYLLVGSLWLVYFAVALLALAPIMSRDLPRLAAYGTSALLGLGRHGDMLSGVIASLLFAYALGLILAVATGTLVTGISLVLHLFRSESSRPPRDDGALNAEEQRAAIDRLASLPLVSDVDPEQWAHVAACFRRLHYDAGDLIIQQGAQDGALYLVVEGQVLVERVEESGLGRAIARLQPGSFFGEAALLRESPRSANVRADTPAVLYRLEGGDFRDLLAQVGASGARARSWIDATIFLQRLPMFKALDPQSLQQLLMSSARREVGAGEVIVREGGEAEHLYVLVNGEAEVLKHASVDGEAADASPPTRRIAVLGEGDYFGEIAIIHGSKRTAEVRATADCELLTIDAEAFRVAIREHLRVGLFFDMAADERVGELSEPTWRWS